MQICVLSRDENQSYLEKFESKSNGDLSGFERKEFFQLPSQISWGVAHTDLEKWIFVQEEAVGHLIVGVNTLLKIPSGGADPCHCLTWTLDHEEYWAVSHYGCGTLSFFKNQKCVQQICYERSGLDPERQKSSHRHFSLLSPCGQYLLSTDLGADRIDIFKVQKDMLQLVQSYALPAGMGPRHLCFDVEGHLWGTAELSNQIFVCLWMNGRLQFLDAICATQKPKNTRNYPSHCEAYLDGIIVSNRGAETMAICSLNLNQIQIKTEFDVKAPFPRYFALNSTHSSLSVGSQHSPLMSIYTLDHLQQFCQIKLSGYAFWSQILE